MPIKVNNRMSTLSGPKSNPLPSSCSDFVGERRYKSCCPFADAAVRYIPKNDSASFNPTFLTMEFNAKKIFVGNLPFTATKNDLEKMFESVSILSSSVMATMITWFFTFNFISTVTLSVSTFVRIE